MLKKEIVAVILAGGKGSRMNENTPKQFLDLNGKPLLYYSLKAFENCNKVDKIILVLPKEYIEYFRTCVQNKYNFKIDKIVCAGSRRQDSVYNALKEIKNCDICLIHDSARPCITNQMILDGIKYAKLYKAAAPCVPVKDTIKICSKEGYIEGSLDRNKLVAMQTPQCFDFDLIKQGHKKLQKENIEVTDDTSIMELLKQNVYLYNGSYSNVKITTKEDLKYIEHLFND